jgi:hypothetical protein
LYRQARVLGVLLLLQVVVIVGIGIWLFASIDWDRVADVSNKPGQVQLQTSDKSVLKRFVRAVLFTVYFLGPVVLSLLAGLGFVLLRRRGWMLASVAQALIMLACLFYYGASRPWFAYPIIAYSILMILLLNSRSVRAVVHRRRLTPAEASAEITHGE